MMDRLNPEQRAAVTLPSGHALVLAGAGSGKTSVLTSRMAWLIQTGQVSPHGLAAVTFTNKAAREMLTRLSSLLPLDTRGMWVGTFHGLCNRLLRAHYRDAGLPQNFQILDIAERGRSLGIVLFSAEQFRSAIHNRVTGNCSTHAYGRTNAIEIAKADYKYVPQVYKNMMTRLKQGEYIIQNPVFRSLLNVKFPKPIYKQYK